jgi:NAD-dependent deacetylase
MSESLTDKINELRNVIAKSKNIVFFGGAGVSTESGIPDFRSESGLYNAKQEFGRSPEELISYSFYVKQPEVFFSYYKKNLTFRDAQPNDAHKALAKLEEDGLLKAVVTQNIDGLHQLAGSRTVYELHGSVMRNYCVQCHAAYDLDYVLSPTSCTEADGVIPRCRTCGGTVKPDVVLYQESLDTDVLENASRAIAAADTLIVGGTSLVVYPAAGLLRYFKGKDLVLINKSTTSYDSDATLIISAPIGEVLRAAVLEG